MRQFFESWRTASKLAPLVRELSWSHNLIILGRCPMIEELLCKSRDAEIVKFALSRSVSPTLISDYRTRLPNKALLRRKLQEFYEQASATIESRSTAPKLSARAGRAKRKKR